MSNATTFAHAINDPNNTPNTQSIKNIQFVDADGTPIDITGGGAQTTIPTGALIPGAGINLVRGENGVITVDIEDKGVTAGMIADGVIPAPYVLPAAGTALGGVKRATYIADPAGDTVTKAEFIALRDALVAAGIMAPKA